MEVEYSIGIKNRFLTLTLDEEDPEDILLGKENLKEEKKDKKKQDKKAAKQGVKDVRQQVNKKEIVNDDNKKENKNDNRRDRERSNRGPRGDNTKRENERNAQMSSGGPRERRDRDDRGEGSRRTGGFGGGDRGGFRKEREPSTRDEGGSPGKEGGDRERGERGGGFGGRGRGRGGRGRGGFGGGRGGPGGGRKREFERRSGSDRSSVKAQEKRDGGGSFNWGSATETGDEDKEVFTQSGEEPVIDWAEASPDPDKVENGESGHDGEEKADESKEEEPKEMTLEEWKELQEKYRSKLDYQTRKPGEGEKKGQWKNTSLLKKNEDSDPLFMQKRVYMYEEKIKTSGRVKHTLDVDYHIASDKGGGGRGRGGRGRGGGRGGRGGRGGFSGRGGRGGGFGGQQDNNREPNFDLTAAEEFPTLGNA